MASSPAFAELSTLLHQATPGGIDDAVAAAITAWLDRHPPTNEQRVELVKARYTLRKVLREGEFSPAAYQAMCELIGVTPRLPDAGDARAARAGVGQASRPAGARVVPPQRPPAARHGDSTTIRQMPGPLPPPPAPQRRGDSTTLRPVPSRQPAPGIRDLERRTTVGAPPQPPAPRPATVARPPVPTQRREAEPAPSEDGDDPTTARHAEADALMPKTATAARARSASPTCANMRGDDTPPTALIATPLGWLALLIGSAVSVIQILPAGSVALGALDRVIAQWPGPLWLVLGVALLALASLRRMEARRTP